jgi:sugar phosphate permease
MVPDSAGFKRQRTIAFSLGAMAFIIAFFHRVAPGAIAADLRDSFSASATMLGFIAALYFYPYAAMQLPSGVLADTIGPRKLFAGGLIVAGAGSLLFALAPGTALLLLGRGLVGLGVAVAFVSVLKLIANWYGEHEFGTWVGVLMMVGNLGGMLATSPLAWITQHVSWRTVFAVVGGLTLFLALCIWLGVRDSPQDKPAAAPARSAGWWAGFSRVAANGRTWPVFAIHFCLIGAYLTFAGLWAVPYMTDGLGYSRTAATLHVTVMILAFAFASFAVGAISDRTRQRLPLLRWLSVAFFLSWTPWVLGWQMSPVVSYFFFILMGVGIAGPSLSWALGKELNPPELAGTATSLVNTGGFLGVAIFQPLVGWVLDQGGSALTVADYRRASIVLAAISLVGLVAAFRIPETGARNVYKGPLPASS